MWMCGSRTHLAASLDWCRAHSPDLVVIRIAVAVLQTRLLGSVSGWGGEGAGFLFLCMYSLCSSFSSLSVLLFRLSIFMLFRFSHSHVKQ